MNNRKLFGMICILLVCLNIANLSTALGHSWPYVGYDLQNSKRSPYDTSHVDGTTKWTFQANESLRCEQTGPVIDSSDTLYFGMVNYTDPPDPEMNGYLYAVTQDGELKWKTHLPRDRLRSSPIIGLDGNIYFSSTQNLHSIDTDGNILWTSENIQGYFLLSRLIALDEHFLVTLNDYEKSVLYALDYDGNIIWDYVYSYSDPYHREDTHESEWAYARPVVGLNGIVYFGTESLFIHNYTKGGYLYAIDQGELIWKKRLDSGVIDLVYGDDDKLYASCLEGNVYAFDLDGELEWSYETEEITTIVLGNNGELIISESGRDIIVLSTDGEKIRDMDLNKSLRYEYISPYATCSGGMIYAISTTNESGTLHAISPDDSVKWEYPFESTPSGYAIGSDGTFYLLTKNGTLYAFGGSIEEKSWLPSISSFSALTIVASTAVILCWRRRTKNRGEQKDDKQP